MVTLLLPWSKPEEQVIDSFLFPFQEKHKQELEDMRKAGHEALSIIVDEYKVGAEILLPLQTQGKLFSCA